MIFPPRPNNITIPAVIAGNILQSDNTSVSVLDAGNDGAIVMRTENTIAMMIDSYQRTMINTVTATGMLNVNTDISTTPAIRMSYQDDRYFDMFMIGTGPVFRPSSENISIDGMLRTTFERDVNFEDHDGISHGLRLAGTLVTASASEINYIDVPAGYANAFKALVLDSNKNIATINRLTANELGGTLITGSQPNITSLDTINVTGTFSLGGVAFDINPEYLQYLDLQNGQEGFAFPRRALVVDINRNIININELRSTYLYGTLMTSLQPNITSLGNLTSLTNIGSSTLNGSTIITTPTTQLSLNYDLTKYSTLTTDVNGVLTITTSGNIVKIAKGLNINGHDGISQGLYLGGFLVTVTADQMNALKATAGTASASKALIVDASKNISGINGLSASTIAGTIVTSTQPYIARVNELDITQHNGSTLGLKLGGTLVTTTATQFNYLSITSPGTAQPNKALILNSTSGISGISSITADSISGTIMVSTQPYINRVNVLNIANHDGGTVGLSLGGALVTADASQLNYNNINEPGVAQASKALILNSGKEISGINKLYSNELYGTLQYGPQPNITSVDTLDITSHNGSSLGLKLGGVLVLPTANELNYLKVTPGISFPSRALIMNASNQITGIGLLQALHLVGTIDTAVQPNISSVNTLNIVNHNGTTTGLSLAGELLRVTAPQINTLGVIAGIAAPSKALIVNGNRDISNINYVGATTVSGVLLTAGQPNISSVETLDITLHDGSIKGLALGGVVVKATANELNYLNITTIGSGEVNKALVLDASREITNIYRLTSVYLSGVLTTASQPNISSVNTLNIVNHTGIAGLQLNNTLVTASAIQLNRINVNVGSAEASKALVVDAMRNISNINSLTASTINGTIQTSSQPYITSVDTLNIAGHNGTNAGLKLNNSLVFASAAQINYNTVLPGTATASKTLVTDVFNSIAGINNLSAQTINASTLNLSGVISNFNTGAVVIKSYSFTNLIGRMIDTRLLTSLSFNSFIPADNITSGYSCEMIGYILPPESANYTFYVLCNDRVRLWVNGSLILHSWVQLNNIQRVSSSLFLNANQWVSIYIQYQVDTGSIPAFSLQWASGAFTQTPIASNQLAWDNNTPPVHINAASQNSFMIYNSDTSAPNTAVFTVNTGGDLTIDASGNDISLGQLDNFNIVSHTGTGSGLMLGGVLVEPTAYEINYLKVNQGVASESKALVVNGSKSISGINALSATSIACANLSADSFTISSLSLDGPLNNYNNGALLIRQITGPNVTGRVIDVDTITAINFTSYDPRGLNLNFSLDIAGFLRPTRSDLHQFHILSSGYVRLWVNNVLILNRWNDTTNIEYASNQISLIEGQWVTFYLQFQNISTESVSIQSALQVQWSTPLMTKQFISSSNMAWDNTIVEPPRMGIYSDELSVYNSSSNLASPVTGTMFIDILGNLQLSGSGSIVSIASNNDFNIVTHNGIKGLRLNGSLVQSSAAELNYLAGVSPGSTSANKAVVLSETGNLGGFTTLSSQYLSGTITTNAQPNITSLGTLNQTLNTTSNIIITSTDILRLSADANACYIQGATEATTNSAADIFIGNYNASIAASNRKFMIKSTGKIGIQTSAPAKALTINGEGSPYCMRLVNNASDGTETQFIDIGVDTSSNLVIGSTGVGSATIGVSTAGIMKIIPSGGSLQIGNTSNNNLPLEIGAASYSVSTTVGYLNSSGSAGTVIPTDVSYSMRTTASIIVNGTICVTSDRRLKTNVKSLSIDKCRDFITNSKPISFSYINDKRKSMHLGLIAQDVASSNFASLVNIAPYPGLGMDYTNDFISPAGAAFTVSYEEIIPILMTTTKDVMNENNELKQRIEKMESMMEEMAKSIAFLKDKLN